MDGFLVFIIVIAIYFAPSIVAGIQQHPKSGGIVTLNLFLGWTFLGWVVALVWAVSGNNEKPDPPTYTHVPEIDPEPRHDDELIEAARNIERIIAACQEASPDAFAILITIASADGKVSRNELSIIANFCIKQGADVEPRWLKSLTRLNSGISITNKGNPERIDELAAISKKPILFIANLHGALTAMTIGSKRISPVAIKLIEKIESLLQEPTSTSEDPKEEQPKPEPSTTEQAFTPAGETLTETKPQPIKPTPFKPQRWVEKAQAELASERKR